MALTSTALNYTLQAGVNGQTFDMVHYDSTTGVIGTTTAVALGATHADLSGNIALSIVAGKIRATVNAGGLTGSLTPRWWTATATVNGTPGVAIDVHIFILDYVTETITAPTTLTQDYPSSSATTHLVINGSGTITGAGHVVNFGSGSELYGSITVGDGITFSGMGSSSAFCFTANCLGSGHVVMGNPTFDACGPVLDFYGAGASLEGGDTYITIGPITVNANSLAPVTSTLAGTLEQIHHKSYGNPVTPSTYDEEMVILKSLIRVENTSYVTFAGKLAGLRCGIDFIATNCHHFTFGNLYSHCTQTLSTWADVTNLNLLTNGTFTIAGKVLLREGEWVLRFATGTISNNVIVSEGISHSFIAVTGDGVSDSVVDGVIVLPGGVSPSNHTSRIQVDGNGTKVALRRVTFVGGVGESFTKPAVGISSSAVVAEVTSCLFYKLQVDRGIGQVGDGAIAPMSDASTQETTTGSPLRPASNPNRMAVANYNNDYQGVSVGSDTYQTYLVGVTAGALGANDLAVDPNFVGGGAYTWDETSLLNRSKTTAAVWAEIRAAFMPQNTALRGAGSGGVDVGAVDIDVVTVTPARILFKNRAA